MSEITRLNKNNVYFSNSCKFCRKYRTDSNLPQNLESNPNRNRDDPAKHQNCDCEFDECILVLGGDWARRATILVILLQKDCLCKLSDLKKSGTHTPHPLTKYEEFSPNKMKFEMRTFRAVTS